MQTHSAPIGGQTTAGRMPSGVRRLTLAMLATEKTAARFAGLETGTSRHGQVLAAFKAAAPYLGYGPRVVHAVDWLFKFTQAQDWEPGNRPIVWPSALMQREALDLGPSQAKMLNRHLTELGLVVMKDSPNGKRYGRRDGKGRILEAYGFDLSPLATRQAEFLAVAAQGRAEREEMRRLRRRATIARNGLTQIIDTVAKFGLLDASWRRLEEEGRGLARSLRTVERLEEMALGVASLERRQREARESLESLLPKTEVLVAEIVDSDPTGPENRPHQYTYKPSFDPEQDTVIATRDSKSRAAGTLPNIQSTMPRERPDGAGGESPSQRPARTDHGTVMRLTTDELVKLAPRLRDYLRTSRPGWPDIVEAADWLRHDLGVSKPLWGEACLAMGREQAAIALAIVSAKPAGHFTGSPGGYFHGMVAKAKAGQLNLGRTVWGLRSGMRRAGTNQAGTVQAGSAGGGQAARPDFRPGRINS